MIIDLARANASVSSSFWSICRARDTDALEIRTLHGSFGWDNNALFRLATEPRRVLERLSFDEGSGLLSTIEGGPRLVFDFRGPDDLVVRVQGGSLALAFHGENLHASGWWVGTRAFNVGSMGIPLQVRLGWSGCTACYDHARRALAFRADAAGGFSVHLRSSRTELPSQEVPGDRESAGTVEAHRPGAGESFRDWADRFGPYPPRYAAAARRAAYCLWSATIPPCGYLERPAVLMSARVMHFVWSWDHCFTAVALASSHPRLAWDQFALMFDCQYPSGRLPDFVGDHGRTEGFPKVPVHGWALQRLLAAGAVPPAAWRWIYDRLGAWTRWWLRDRDDDRDGVCQYNHGNECQDNATIFDEGCPVISPDLGAYLATQADALADLAARLDLRAEAAEWRARADALVARMLERFWRGDRFEAYHAPTGRRVGAGSVTALMPLVLGERLPPDVFAALARRLGEPGGHLAPHGLASEALGSPSYGTVPAFWRGSVYWRGPVWAPLVLLLADGLRRGGAADLAADLARRFCDTVDASGGFFEDYDAVTGAGLDDAGYTWTAAAFLALARDVDRG